MPESTTASVGVGRDKGKLEFINVEEDMDTGDSEFEPPEGNGAQDDDSITAEEDVADEEEVDGLMRESEMSLSELLASYGLPTSAASVDTTTVVTNASTSGERSTLHKRRHNGNTGQVTADESPSTHVSSIGILPRSADSKADSVKAIEIDLTSSNGEAEEEEELVGDGIISNEVDDDANIDEDDDDDYDDDDEEEIESDSKNHTVSMWCQALVAGDSPPAYNSDEDEDYLPNVEGEGDWRGEMHVGEDYQANVPPALPHANSRRDSHLGLESMMLWRPSHLSEAQVENYQQNYSRILTLAAPSTRVPDDEEALFLLLRSNFDSDEALHRLQMKPVHPNEILPYLETWSELDCTSFERDFITFHKNFFQIQQNKLRHKTVAELVHFYYLWKKTARHDEFIRLYRREKKKPLHPGITDFMDCLMKEQLFAVAGPPERSVVIKTDSLNQSQGSVVILKEEVATLSTQFSSNNVICSSDRDEVPPQNIVKVNCGNSVET